MKNYKRAKVQPETVTRIGLSIGEIISVVYLFFFPSNIKQKINIQMIPNQIKIAMEKRQRTKSPIDFRVKRKEASDKKFISVCTLSVQCPKIELPHLCTLIYIFIIG